MQSFASSNEYNNSSQLFQSLADNASANHKNYVGNPILRSIKLTKLISLNFGPSKSRTSITTNHGDYIAFNRYTNMNIKYIDLNVIYESLEFSCKLIDSVNGLVKVEEFSCK